MSEQPPVIDRLIEERRFSLGASILLAAGVLPFAVLALFGRPRADDFAFGWYVNEYGVLGSLPHWYQHMPIRYFSNTLVGVYYAIGGHGWLYAVFPFALFAGLWLALWRLLLAASPFLMSSRQALHLSGILCALFVATAPSATDGFLWLNSAFNYTPGLIAGVFLFSLLLGHAATTGRLALTVKLIACSLLAAAAVGTNESFMLQIDVLLFIVTCESFLRRRANRWLCLICVIVAAGGSIIVMAAPGNAVRFNDAPNSRDFMFSLGRSGLMALARTGTWLANPALLGLTLLIAPWLAHHARHAHARWRTPRTLVLIILFGLGWVFIGMFPHYFGLGRLAPRRLLNVLYFGHILAWLTFVFVCLGIWSERSQWVYSRRVAWVGLMALAIGLAVVSRVPRAVGDLLQLPPHLKEMAERDAIIREQIAAGRRNLTVPVYSRTLTTLCYESLGDAPVGSRDHWINNAYAMYLGVSSIRTVVRETPGQ